METQTFEVSDFQADVLEASREIPVLVDFWAPWCGPCRVLGPVLENLARAEGSAWRLIKVNTDAHPELSARYGIRGIPAVKLFVDGEVVDEFTGALPEYAVRQWLEKAIPSENKQRVARAQLLLEEDPEAAERLLEQILREEPEPPLARILLARLLAFRDPRRAEELVDGAPFAGPDALQVAEAVRTVARLLRMHEEPAALPDEAGRAHYEAALAALARRDFDGALTHFIEVIGEHRGYDDDGARRACLAIFTLLGEQHPVTQQHRRSFNMALY